MGCLYAASRLGWWFASLTSAPASALHRSVHAGYVDAMWHELILVCTFFHLMCWQAPWMWLSANLNHWLCTSEHECRTLHSQCTIVSERLLSMTGHVSSTCVSKRRCHWSCRTHGCMTSTAISCSESLYTTILTGQWTPPERSATLRL